MNSPVKPIGDSADARRPLDEPLPPRRRRALRWTAGVAVAFVAVVAVCELAGWPFLRGPLQARAEAALQAPVRIDAPFRLQLIVNPGLQAARVVAGVRPGFDAPHLVLAEDLAVRWRWHDVIARADGEPWRLREIGARKLDAHLVRLPNGSATWQAGAAAGGESPTPNSAFPLQVETLALQDGSIRYLDALTQADLVVRVTGSELDARQSAFSATAKGRWGRSVVDLQASTGGALAFLQPSSGTASAAPASASGAASTAAPVAFNVGGRIGKTALSFRGQAVDLLGQRVLRGDLVVIGPSLAAVGEPVGLTLPDTPPFHLRGTLSHDGGVWQLATPSFQIGGSRLAADLRFDTRPMVARLDGGVRAQLLRLKDLGPSIGAAPPADAAGRVAQAARGDAAEHSGTDGGTAGAVRDAVVADVAADVAVRRSRGDKRPMRVLPDKAFDLPSLRAMNAAVKLDIAALDLGDDAVIAPLRNVSTTLQLEGGVLTLADLDAQAAGGRVQGLTRLDAARADQPAQWQADLQFTGMRLEQWVRGLRQGGAPLARGQLDAGVHVRGQGRSTAAILASLDGDARARLRDGELSHLLLEMAGLDVAQSLGVLVRGDHPLPLRCARVDTAIHKGIVQVRDAFFDTRDSAVRVTGQISFADESLALRTEVTPKDFSPLSLRAPIIVGGHWSSPELGIEGRRLAPRLLAALALAIVAPPAALLPLMEFGKDDAQAGDGCKSPPTPQPPQPPQPSAAAAPQRSTAGARGK
jgi:AsmA family protein